jgi:tRNA G18 (ribose-2'-O)-methylase SpoU
MVQKTLQLASRIDSRYVSNRSNPIKGAAALGSRYTLRRREAGRRQARKRFERQRRLNRLASPGIHRLVVVLDHLKPRFNIGKIFRSAEAFGVEAVHLIGTDFFDPAPAMGSFKWVPARFYETFAQSYRQLRERGYAIFILDPDASHGLPHAILPLKCAFVFGHEEFGFSFRPDDYPDLSRVSVPQLGKVQSLNVAVAASLAMYEYVRQRMEPSCV